MERTHWRRFTPIVIAVVSTYPVGALLSLYLFAYRARLALGYWPDPHRPEPKSLGFDLHHLQIGIGLMSFPFVSLVSAASIVLARKLWRDFPMWRLLGLVGICFALGFSLLKWDPGQFAVWFFD